MSSYAEALASHFKKRGAFVKGSGAARRELSFKALIKSVGRTKIRRTKKSSISLVRSGMTAYDRRYKMIKNPILPNMPKMPTIEKPSHGPKPIPSAMTKKINRTVSQLWSAR